MSGVNGPEAKSDSEPDKILSYSDKLKTNIRYDQRLKRNILEITLEKTDSDASIDIDGEDVARVAKTLGIDVASQTQGYQIQFKGKFSVISMWMVQGLSLDKFCKDVNIRITDNVITGAIRPAGKQDVTVSIVGLDFNTPDTFVFDYLNKFGVVVNESVLYSKFESGPWKGKYSGERKYQVDFSQSDTNMGTYHLIDGCKVRVYYRGNKKTCGRCHKTAQNCPGQALAKDCGDNGGDRIPLSEHMKLLWDKIGFKPTTFSKDDCNEGDDINGEDLIRDSQFPSLLKRPDPTSRDIECYEAISIKNIPLSVSDPDIVKFLVSCGVPNDHSIDNFKISKKTNSISVIVESLTTGQVEAILKSIHFPETRQKFFNCPLYCKPIRKLTPTKPDKSPNDNVSKSPELSTNTVPTNNANKSEFLIPGLSKSQQKKALRKARKKKANIDDVTSPKNKLDFLKKDLLKCGLQINDIEGQYDFEDVSEPEETAVNQTGSKFFQSVPPDQNQSKKRIFSPESVLDLRKTRLKQT